MPKSIRSTGWRFRNDVSNNGIGPKYLHKSGGKAVKLKVKFSESMKTKRLVLIGLVVGLVVVATFWTTSRDKINDGQSKIASQPMATVSNLYALLTLPVAKLEHVDIARMNLLCAQGLPGAEDLDVDGNLAVLSEMAERVRSETERHEYRFHQNPAEFENSEGFFKMLMLAVVLREDFRVEYAPGKIGTAADAWTGDGFFADTHDVFLHGLTGSKHQGTCSSLPVLQVAVGRRLGYPLRLVTTKGHLFVRWEDSRERFNVEATGQGVNRFADDYYHHWPVEVSEQEVRAGGYLKSLSAAEELAVFLSIRGMCCQEAKRYEEAAESFRVAVRLAPGCQEYQVMALQLERKLTGKIAVGHMN